MKKKLNPHAADMAKRSGIPPEIIQEMLDETKKPRHRDSRWPKRKKPDAIWLDENGRPTKERPC